MSVVKIGILGGGFGGGFPWDKHPNCKVAAVCDMNPESLSRLAETYKCDNCYSSLDEMLKDKELEAIAVFSGAPDHSKHCISVMKAGKHVLSAVPCATTIEDCEAILETVNSTGMKYMMAETSYWVQATISARKFYQEGAFGEIYYSEAEYHHAGLEALFTYPNGSPTWRYGYPPMLYPTHSTAFLLGVTGERLTEVVCHGWGDDSKFLKDNAYNNPFCNETALFKTNRGNAFRVSIFWKGAHKGTDRAQYYGTKMSFFMGHPHFNFQSVIVRDKEYLSSISSNLPDFEIYEQPKWYLTDMLPETLRFDTFHGGSHVFIVHEFIDSILKDRKPAVDIYEAIAYTVPGIIAHKSAIEGGSLLKIPVYD